MLTLDAFKEARSVLQGVLLPTPLIHSPYLSKLWGNHVYLKPENMQVTGAYKIRGAYFKISTLSPEEKERGLITASAGNHAQGVAYAARAAGVGGHHRHAHHHSPGEGEQHQGLRGRGDPPRGGVRRRGPAGRPAGPGEGLTYVHPFNDLTLATGQGHHRL